MSTIFPHGESALPNRKFGYNRYQPECLEAFAAYRECKKDLGRKKRANPNKSIADLFR